MKPDPVVLQSCLLFRGKSVEAISGIIRTLIYSVRTLHKNELVVNEGETADRIGIVLSGKVEVQKHHSNGNIVTIARLGKGQTFGEAVLFRKENVFPATVVAEENCAIMFIGKKELLRMFASDTDMMSRYMETLSERLLMVNHKIEILSAGTLRQRIIFYLLKQADLQNSDTVKLPFSRKVWAELLNAARPSLSRELAYLRDNGWLEFKSNMFTVHDRVTMERLLQKNTILTPTKKRPTRKQIDLYPREK